MNRPEQIANRLREMRKLLEAQLIMTPTGNLLLPGYLADLAVLPELIVRYEAVGSLDDEALEDAGKLGLI